MEDLTSEHLEHAEHAEHAAHEGNPFIVTVSVTIAIIAVIAATVGSLETVESGKAINEKNEAVLAQTRASDTYAYYQAKAVKQKMYEIAADSGGAKAAEYTANAKKYDVDGKKLVDEAKEMEKKRDEKLEQADRHESRHHILTAGVTLLHVAIAVATIAIITRGSRWPWLLSIAMTVAGVAVSSYAYIGH